MDDQVPQRSRDHAPYDYELLTTGLSAPVVRDTYVRRRVPVYGQDDLVVPILDLLAQTPSGLTTTDLIRMLWERLTPTGENAEPSPSRPGERKFDQIVRNTTGPERHRLTGLVEYRGPGQPMTTTEAGTQRLAAARASGEWSGFDVPAPRLDDRVGRPAVISSDTTEDANAGRTEGASSDERRDLRRPRGRIEATGFGAPYRPVDATVSVMPRVAFTVDPEAIDRGTTEHKRAQTAVSDALRALGIEPLSPSAGDPDFDVGWRIGEAWFVAEVKSLTAANEATQVRLGIGQVLEYRHVLNRRHPNVRAVLVLEREPDMGRWSELLESLGIDVVWPATLDAHLARLMEAGG